MCVGKGNETQNNKRKPTEGTERGGEKGERKSDAVHSHVL
jgi:hypothetical protein